MLLVRVLVLALAIALSLALLLLLGPDYENIFLNCMYKVRIL